MRRGREGEDESLRETEREGRMREEGRVERERYCYSKFDRFVTTG